MRRKKAVVDLNQEIEFRTTNPLVSDVLYIPFRVFVKILGWYIYIYQMNQKWAKIAFRVIFLCWHRTLWVLRKCRKYPHTVHFVFSNITAWVFSLFYHIFFILNSSYEFQYVYLRFFLFLLYLSHHYVYLLGIFHHLYSQLPQKKGPKGNIMCTVI
jgi:hypothetical protein